MDYFGYNETNWSYNYGTANACWYNLTQTWGDFSFVCPGTGNQTLKRLGTYCRSAGGTAGVVRLAIYDTSNNFIAQGSAGISVTSTSAGWVEHTEFVDVDGDSISPVLTGGQGYRIAVAISAADTKLYYNKGSTGDQYAWALTGSGDDKTYAADGYPDPIPQSGGGSQAYRVALRAGVEAAGLVVPIIQNYCNQMRH